ncbi:curved DNA-binding protein, DnaJ homologue that functions as a co-chaperone of DnaK [Burkholderia sp. 8Y]|uniref:DnaJ C-terminal domain-containing protein n=1 Tax=Burkholderia sp. 8Y TaxID=2653133 RepID=UPI0012EF820B|nr:DnaJ C-terminal domain-containing protein [Burkholderia sp. 8Y]VXC96436.1 curved DNA-binding protein, DnaJ homologue that functions as a co-chaperone of DnaK [Burkholderia sp. 8Y]
MRYKDYYAVMGVPRTATEAEIKTAHRKLARKFHPDLNKDPNAEERFKEVGEAWDVLKDPEKRAAFDALGTGYKNGDEIRPRPDMSEEFAYGGGNESHDVNDDFFSDLFGRRARHASRSYSTDWPGEDLHARVSVSLEDLYNGAQRTVSLQMPVIDDQGRMTYQTRTLDVAIPKGILDGQGLRLAGQGGTGIGNAPRGDLYLEIELEEHGRYRVEGRDVTTDLPLAPWEAALGADVLVPTPSGDVTVTVPAQSSAGRRLRLKGRGIPGNPPGDFYVTLEIVLPPADTDANKAAYVALREASHFDARAHYYG